MNDPVKCPQCGTEWELDAEESRQPVFTCQTCNTTFSIEPDNNPEIAGDAPPQLRLSQLVVVFLRLLILSWALQVIDYLIVVMIPEYHGPIAAVGEALAIMVFGLGLGFLWVFSPAISRMVTRGQESAVSCGGLKLVDIYGFAFLTVGLYFVASFLGPSLEWLYYSLQ